MLNYILLCIAFYLIGSIPTAYILVKLKYKKDLISEGSGNIGARNTFDVTNSRLDGIIVLLLDFIKGFLPVLLLINNLESGFGALVFPMLCLIIGHNYSIWLKFKGGRGLATGAGVMAAVNFTLVILWLVFYFIAKALVKNVHIACVIALIILPLSIFILKDIILRFNSHSLLFNDGTSELFAFTSAVCIIILLKHIEPVMVFFRKVD
ncbi:MAG: glycerol-3-phosphate acyltransferase [Ignavibacteria bacterium]